MGYRCVNNLLMYCETKPKAGKLNEPVVDSNGNVYATLGECRNDYKTCPDCKGLQEVSQVEVEKLRARLVVNKKGGK